MPINNESKISLEFTYEFPLPNNQDGQGILFPLRFHHTEEMGAVVTFLDKDGKPTDVQLPAVMFAEVSEFLQAKGVIEGRFHQHHSPLPQPMIVSSGTRLGVPTISRQPMSPKEQQIRRAERHDAVAGPCTVLYHHALDAHVVPVGDVHAPDSRAAVGVQHEIGDH
jgi:hypothetical protein